MKFEDSLKDKIREFDIKNPQYALLLKQALDSICLAAKAGAGILGFFKRQRYQ
jgi:hypothetical protein